MLASFDTPEEAQGWFARQPELPSHAFVRIAGELHLWVYHRPYHPVREDSSTGST